MCGIAGIMIRDRNTASHRNREKIQKALTVLAHRGPDAEGIVTEEDGRIILGHRRLSIIDLSQKGNQPMQLPDEKLVITYNGEIYNFKDLRKELETRGEKFFSASDTEVLLRGYKIWGIEKLLERINGMFCFALYDGRKKEIFLVRDRVGIKPLYYALYNNSLYFSSEIQGLLAIWPAERKLNLQSFSLYLNFKFTPSPLTLFDGIKRLQPGTYAQCDLNGGMSIRQYWHPLTKRKSPNEQKNTIEIINNEITHAVERRLVSDVPIALFLSGGIDSSMIAAKLNELHIQNLTTYSIGYKDQKKFNELVFSRMVADRYPLDYHEILTDSREAERLLLDEKLILDEPISDVVWIPLYLLCKQAHQDHFKVILLGEGSDEQFVGYDSMMSLMKEQKHWGMFFALFPGLAYGIYTLLSPLIKKMPYGHRTFDLIRRIACHEPLYVGSSIGWWETQKHQVMGKKMLQYFSENSAKETLSWDESPHMSSYTHYLHDHFTAHASEPADIINRICFIEIYTKMTEVLLHRVDRISMQHSIEARVPFLDHNLVEHSFQIPGKHKIRNGEKKFILKKIAAQYLPEKVIHRKKMGFSFPLKEWLKGSLGKMVESTFHTSRLFKEDLLNQEFCLRILHNHQKGTRDYASQIWTLYNLCRWHDKWIG